MKLSSAWLFPGVLGLVLSTVACSPASPPSPTAAPVKPKEVAKPAAKPTEAVKPAAEAQPKTAPQAKLTPISVGVLGSTADSPTYIAVEKGFFKDQGLEVSLVRFNTTNDMVAPMASKQLDVGTGGINAAIFNAINQGIPMKLVADKNSTPADFPGTGWYVRTDLADKLKTPADLKGMTIALGAKCSVAESELNVLLQKGGLAKNDVAIKDVRYADQVAAFANKSIDVTYIFEPFSSSLQSNGYAKLWMTSGSVIPNHVQSVIIYGPGMLDRPDLARAWMIGYVMGAREWIKAARAVPLSDEITQILVKHGDEKDPEKVRAIKPAPLSPNVTVPPDSVRADVDFFRAADCIETTTDVDQVVDNSFNEYAVSKLGPFQP